MMNVTKNAKKRLQDIRKNGSEDSEKVLRLIPANEKQDAYELILDSQHEGDHVVKSANNNPLLAISEDLTGKLGGMVLDYQEFRDGGVFSLHNPQKEDSYVSNE